MSCFSPETYMTFMSFIFFNKILLTDYKLNKLRGHNEMTKCIWNWNNRNLNNTLNINWCCFYTFFFVCFVLLSFDCRFLFLSRLSTPIQMLFAAMLAYFCFSKRINNNTKYRWTGFRAPGGVIFDFLIVTINGLFIHFNYFCPSNGFGCDIHVRDYI